MWEISSYNQYLCFLYSVAVGGFIGIIYDFFKIDRKIFKRGVAFIVFEDILFWVISAFVFFSFSVVFSNGQIRGYLLFGTSIGFTVYKLTLSKVVIMLILPIKKLTVIIKKFYLLFLEKTIFYCGFLYKKIKSVLNLSVVLKKGKNNKIIEKNS